MLIDGEWRPGSTGKSGVVLNPATGWIYISYSPCELPPNVRNSKCVTVVDPFTYRLSRCRESGNTDPCTSQSFHRA